MRRASRCSTSLPAPVFRSVEDRLDCGELLKWYLVEVNDVFRSVEDRLDCGFATRSLINSDGGVFRSVEDRLDCGSPDGTHATNQLFVFRSVEDRLDCGATLYTIPQASNGESSGPSRTGSIAAGSPSGSAKPSASLPVRRGPARLRPVAAVNRRRYCTMSSGPSRTGSIAARSTWPTPARRKPVFRSVEDRLDCGSGP